MLVSWDYSDQYIIISDSRLKCSSSTSQDQTCWCGMDFKVQTYNLSSNYRTSRARREHVDKNA